MKSILQPFNQEENGKQITNLAIGDVVLLKDTQVNRNEWPTGLIVNIYPDRDKRVHKVDVRVIKDGIPKVYTRPISETVLLVKG